MLLVTGCDADQALTNVCATSFDDKVWMCMVLMFAGGYRSVLEWMFQGRSLFVHSCATGLDR